VDLKDSRIFILYTENGFPLVESFGKNELCLVKNKIKEIENTEGQRLLWLVSGKLLNITLDGNIYG